MACFPLLTYTDHGTTWYELHVSLVSFASSQVFFILGEFALVVIAVAFSNWRGQFAAGAVLCGASLLLWFVVPESGRWLQVQGRGEEAYQVGMHAGTTGPGLV